MSSTFLDTRTKILAATWRLMERRRGQGVRMSDIAVDVGISRQAVYLHFATRTELMIATTHYVDEARDLKKRLERYNAATDGVEMLEEFVEFWGNYIPEVYGLAKALLALYDTDEAAAAAWNDRMQAIRSGCVKIITTLQNDGMLASDWTPEKAIDFFWTILSIHNWEQLTINCGWSINQYVSRIETLLKQSFIKESKSRKKIK